MAGPIDVAIVGGGIAGLGAAHACAKRGASFLLLEASARLGGVICTEKLGDFVLEGGPDAILAQKPEGLALSKELGLDSRLAPTNTELRTLYILCGGRLKAMPEGMALAIPTRVAPFLKSDVFSWPGKLRMGLDLFVPQRRDGADESIASFMTRRLGREANELLGEPLLAGIHAGDPEQLSMKATFPRFVEMEEKHGSLLKAMWAARQAMPPAKGNGKAPAPFFSYQDGLGELVEALLGRLPAASVRLSSPVEAFEKTPDGWLLRISGGETVEARALLPCLPAPKLAPLLAPLDEPLARLLESIPFVSSATVLLGYKREQIAHPLDGYGMVIPVGEKLKTMAFSFLSTKRPGCAPPGHALLRGFLGGARDEGVLEAPDAELVAIVIREMGPHFGISGEPLFSRVYRWPRTTPQMTVGHFGRLARLEALAAAHPGLHLAGAGLRVTGIPDTYTDGVKTAEAALAALSSPALGPTA